MRDALAWGSFPPPRHDPQPAPGRSPRRGASTRLGVGRGARRALRRHPADGPPRRQAACRRGTAGALPRRRARAELDHGKHRLPPAAQAQRAGQAKHRARRGERRAGELLADPEHRHDHRGDHARSTCAGIRPGLRCGRSTREVLSIPTPGSTTRGWSCSMPSTRPRVAPPCSSAPHASRRSATRRRGRSTFATRPGASGASSRAHWSMPPDRGRPSSSPSTSVRHARSPCAS